MVLILLVLDQLAVSDPVPVPGSVSPCYVGIGSCAQGINEEEEEDCWKKAMFKNCLKEGKIPFLITGKCFRYGSPGPCEDGKRLFLVADTCSTEEGISIIY